MKFDDFLNEVFENDKEVEKEYKILEIKYKLIEEMINFRRKNDLTQKSFAEKIGVKQQAISRFEKGEIDPRLSFISKIITGMKKEFKLDDQYESFKEIKTLVRKRKKIDNEYYTFNNELSIG